MNNQLECLPKCPTHKMQMEIRSQKHQTYEQKWCGIWYDCIEPGCYCSVLYESAELREFLNQSRSNGL